MRHAVSGFGVSGGQSLRQELSGGAIPLRRAVEYGTEIAQGLAAAHEQGIIHAT